MPHAASEVAPVVAVPSQRLFLLFAGNTMNGIRDAVVQSTLGSSCSKLPDFMVTTPSGARSGGARCSTSVRVPALAVARCAPALNEVCVRLCVCVWACGLCAAL